MSKRFLLTYLICLASATLAYAAIQLVQEDAWTWEDWLLGPLLYATVIAVAQELGHKKREQANG